MTVRPMRATLLLLALALPAACAGSYQPIVDQSSIADPARYQQDLAECRSYAEQVSPGRSTAAGAGAGALLGGAIGAVTGAFTGDFGTGAGIGASTGAIAGGASGAGHGAARQRDVIDQCLRYRGYAVLG